MCCFYINILFITSDSFTQTGDLIDGSKLRSARSILSQDMIRFLLIEINSVSGTLTEENLPDLKSFFDITGKKKPTDIFSKTVWEKSEHRKTFLRIALTDRSYPSKVFHALKKNTADFGHSYTFYSVIKIVKMSFTYGLVARVVTHNPGSGTARCLKLDALQYQHN